MLSERLKVLRKRDRITQTEFAKKFNVSAGTVGNWETGAREPDYQTLLRIADFFDVTVDYLLGKEEKSSVAGTTENDFKVALFGGDGEVTDEMWDEVKQFAEYIKAKYKKG